jgi:hypothetical protein
MPKRMHCMSFFCGFGGKIRSIIGQNTHDVSGHVKDLKIRRCGYFLAI